MSKYTTELRYLLDPLTTGFVIGLDEYPIFDESYRAALNAKILKHFFFREIGAETPAKFKYFLNRTMDEIMPLYNQMYASQLITFDPLRTYELTETSTKNTSGSTTGNESSTKGVVGSATDNETSTKEIVGSSTGSGTSGGTVTTNDAATATASQVADNLTVITDAATKDTLSVVQDTPQKSIVRADLLTNLYASKATHDTETDGSTSNNKTDNTTTSENNSASVGVQENTSTGSSTAESLQNDTSTAARTSATTQNDTATAESVGSITNLDEYTHRVFGNIRYKDMSELLIDFRKTFLNIDMKILEDLDSCFMQIW